MPVFLSDEEFRRCSHDSGLVAEKADAFIQELYNQMETIKAEAEAASITSEQTCSLIEQKYISLSAEFSTLQTQHSDLNSSLEQRSIELGQLQSEKQQILLQSIEKDGTIERLTREAAEFHKSKRQLLELLEQKDLEISEKNATIKSYLDKIVNLTESSATKEAHLSDVEAESARLHATSARILQEKELLERHNTWLNEELTSKVGSLIQLQKTNRELEADLSSKVADVEKKFKESSSSLNLQKDRVRDLEAKLASMEKELLSNNDAAAAAEERFSTEISTANKLVELYKESSEEWSKKAGELEGVIKALETHLNQVENEYKDKLEKEEALREQVEKESSELKEKLHAMESELGNLRKEKELKQLPLSSFTIESRVNSIDAGEMIVDDHAIVPKIPVGVSGTALAASLLRDGWSLAKIYVKYHEAVDALRHEELGRKQTQTVLERVLYEIEEKAGVIMEEREEHKRLAEAYSALNQKLQDSLSEHSAQEITIQELKASLRRKERDEDVARKEIVDLQKQVAVLLKECRDIQLRCGSISHGYDNEAGPAVMFNADSDAENIISERLLTFKDINGLVEQNVQLRSLVQNLSNQIDEKEADLKEKFEKERQKYTNEAASKVNAVLARAEEQAQMIESLHTSVTMYKKLYEEERKLHATHPPEQLTSPEKVTREVLRLNGSNHDMSANTQERTFERIKTLEEDFAKSRSEIISLRAERDKFALEAQFAQEKLARFMKEFDHQREEHNGVISRNVEFSQLIVDYQRKLRESAESVNASDERARKLTMEASILKHEKEILQNSEKRASDEVRSLSERLHRLQASLDTIQSTEEAREEARAVEKRKQEEYVRKIEREWAEAKSQLQEERDKVRKLTLDRESTLKDTLRQVEELSKELANVLQSIVAAESRAAVAEARCSDMEKIMEATTLKDSDAADGVPSSSSTEKVLANFRDEIENLRAEAQASKDHMHQYKSIAQANEEALKQLESAHEILRVEADEARRSLETEVQSLKERINELESECVLKSEETRSAVAEKEEALAGALSEIASLKEDYLVKTTQIGILESQISSLKEGLENEHQSWRTAKNNYDRQVISQSDTIQELIRTSQALASAQEESSELQKVVDLLKNENNELKSKWEAEKLAIEVYRNDADKKYNEVNELNKILHSRLEALHIKLAETEQGKASGSSSQAFASDDGLQNVVKYLRRSKEIAETEISLLKQEKLRLQSQLDIALKSAEAAQTSLHSEREKSRSSLFSEEEFKSLQLQVRELTLLRESNVQLREENRHNFEECQKLREALLNVRTEFENLEKLLREREAELGTQRKEVENLKTEKVQFEKRIDELVGRCKDVDVDDYNRLKESFQQMQMNLKDKDAQLAEIKKLLLEKQVSVSVLEGDLARTRMELNERETRINEILQTEASLRSEVERFKRSNAQFRRSLKEKEEQIQALSKQLEDARQVKRNYVDPAAEQALREKEREKDARSQMLEKMYERVREDLKKEKEDNIKLKAKIEKTKKTILESNDSVTQQKDQLSAELKKHQQSLKMLQDAVEKLKSRESQTESAEVQHFGVPLLEDLASSYFQAVEKFEQVAQPACAELDADVPANAPLLDNASSAGTVVGQAATSLKKSPSPPATNPPTSKTADERERRFAIPRTNIKGGRRLVRPNITKPKEPQGDEEMSEADDSNNVLQSQTSESQGNLTAPTVSLVRKRASVSSTSDTPEEMVSTEETQPDIPAPVQKRPKPSESLQDAGEEPVAPVKIPEVVASERSDDVGDVQQDIKDEPFDADREESETAVEHVEEAADDQIQVDEPVSNTVDDATDKSDKPSEAVLSDDQLRDQTERDVQQIILESGHEMEEGEVVADSPDNDGNSNISNEQEGPEDGELQGEQGGETVDSPVDEPLEAGEIDPSPTPQTPEEEKNDGVDMTENTSSDKHPDVADAVSETDQNPEPSNAAVDGASTSSPADTVSEQGGSTAITSDAGGKPVSPVSSSSRTINLSERARERSSIRQAAQAALFTPPQPPSRARGRPSRARGSRGGRLGRGQSPG